MRYLLTTRRNTYTIKQPKTKAFFQRFYFMITLDNHSVTNKITGILNAEKNNNEKKGLYL